MGLEGGEKKCDTVSFPKATLAALETPKPLRPPCVILLPQGQV